MTSGTSSPTTRGVDEPRFGTLAEIRDAARARLNPRVWTYIESGAEEERTLHENRAAFARWQIRPRYLNGMGPPTLATDYLGIPLSLPVLTAPFGADRLFHPDGYKAVARAAADFGTACVVPAGGSFSLEAVAEAGPEAAQVFQLHPVGSERTFHDLAARAEAAGFHALCVTIDSPTVGFRDRTRRDRFMWPQIEADVMSGNYLATDGEMLDQLVDYDQPLWSWEQLGDVCARVGLPFVVKGILTGEDARQAIDHGASGLIVSNHGGRQLDGLPASLDQLAEVAEAAGDDVSVALDSGVRRGADVLKALALGADVVMIGRLTVLGLAADGAAGVRRTLELLHEEMRTAMTLAGRSSVDDIDQTLVQRPAWAAAAQPWDATSWAGES